MLAFEALSGWVAIPDGPVMLAQDMTDLHPKL
jgi:hypothetical protein